MDDPCKQGATKSLHSTLWSPPQAMCHRIGSPLQARCRLKNMNQSRTYVRLYNVLGPHTQPSNKTFRLRRQKRTKQSSHRVIKPLGWPRRGREAEEFDAFYSFSFSLTNHSYYYFNAMTSSFCHEFRLVLLYRTTSSNLGFDKC